MSENASQKSSKTSTRSKRSSKSKTSGRSKNGSEEYTISRETTSTTQTGVSDTYSQKDKKNMLEMLTDFEKCTLGDYKIKQLSETPLFSTVLSSDGKRTTEKRDIDASFLITGFGMRNLKSLQDALQLKDDERKRYCQNFI